MTTARPQTPTPKTPPSSPRASVSKDDKEVKSTPVVDTAATVTPEVSAEQKEKEAIIAELFKLDEEFNALAKKKADEEYKNSGWSWTVVSYALYPVVDINAPTVLDTAQLRIQRLKKTLVELQEELKAYQKKLDAEKASFIVTPAASSTTTTSVPAGVSTVSPAPSSPRFKALQAASANSTSEIEVTPIVSNTTPSSTPDVSPEIVAPVLVVPTEENSIVTPAPSPSSRR